MALRQYTMNHIAAYLADLERACTGDVQRDAIGMAIDDAATILTLADEPELLVETMDDVVAVPDSVIAAARMRDRWESVCGHA